MKKSGENAKKMEVFRFTELRKVRPVPFGDVRKYYLAAKVGVVVLLALIVHISVAAWALRTDTCDQLSNALIVAMILSSLAVIVGHYMRSLLGYGISAVGCLLLILLLQFGNGGAPVALVSDLPEYGEVFRDGAKSTDFWILLAKVIAVVHLLLTVLFIRSTLTVTEEPPLKGMNVQIARFKAWLDKNNNSLPPGRRASDYWFVAVSLVLWMTFVAYDPSMGKYDYWSMGLLLVGCILVACKQTFMGSMLMSSSALIRCTMFQWRFGICIPVVAAYLGMWVALLYFVLESERENKKSIEKSNPKWIKVLNQVLMWSAVGILIWNNPLHGFLSTFSGPHLINEKDVLPLLFFIPLLIFFATRSKRLQGVLFSIVGLSWLWQSYCRSTPRANNKLFQLLCTECHGTIGVNTTDKLNTVTDVLSIASIVLISGFTIYAIGIIVTYVVIKLKPKSFSLVRRRNGINEKNEHIKEKEQ